MSEPAEPTWRPIVVDGADLQALRDDPGVEVVDTLDQQRRDLGRVLPAPAPEHLDEASRWFHYPWRRQVVRLLGPDGFTALRTDRNRNKITAQEQQRLRATTVGVVGLSVGHAIAHTIALEGACGEIRLADFDEIELSNLNRIPGTVFDLGVNKAVLAARRIAEIDPYVRVVIEPAGLSPETIDDFVRGLDVVIEECDSFDVKLLLRESAKRLRVPLVMETSDRGLLDVERYDLEPDRPVFHGLLGDVDPRSLMGLRTHDKVPYVLRVLEAPHLSAVMAASMTEVDETVTTWPQLGGDITLGAASVAAAVRRLGLGRPLASGRVRIDLQESLDALAPPELAEALPPPVAGDADVAVAPTEAREAVLDAATLAPSGGNTQPWWMRLTADALELRLDPSQTSTLDVAYRGSHVALGAAVFNARVAAARHGVLGPVVTTPARTAEGVPTARVRLGLADGRDPGLAGLYEAMRSRVSNRHLPQDRSLPADVLQTLREAAEAEGGHWHAVTDRDRLGELAELLGESDRLRYLTPGLHADMMRELRWPPGDDVTWGLDVRSLELDASDLAKLGVARRADVMATLAEQDLGRALGESTRDRLLATPALVVVTGDGGTPEDDIRAGQAVERVWVQAEALGLAVHAMSPVFLYARDPADFTELSAGYADRLRRLADRFADLTGIGTQPPALVLRLGYADPVTVRARRRPATWDDVPVETEVAS